MRTNNIIDFNRVPEDQFPIHDRLVNWGIWCRPRWGSAVSPMFKMAISMARARDGRDQPRQVDELDAKAIQAAFSKLSGRERRALSWCYVTQGSVKKAEVMCGTDKRGLYDLICQARASLTQMTEKTACTA